MKEEKGGEKQTPSSSAAAPAAPAVSLPPPNQGSAAPPETLAAASPRGTPMVAVPVVAVPCFLAPAGILESPGFTGQFAMTHQALLATVTAQALQASEALKNSFHQPMLSPVLSPMSPSPLQQRTPTFESSVSTPEDLRAQSTQIIVKTSSSDGYNWRKYGQKQVKSSDRSRSYYRCTNSNCLAKKKVERCPDGRETEIIYRGQHNHDPPQKTRSSKERGSQSSGPIVENKNPDVPSDEVNESDPSISKQEQNLGNETPERQLYCSSDCEGDAAVRTEEECGDESDPKRRLIEYTQSFSEPVLKTIKEPKIVVQSARDATRASDGYKWRKYGQKLVKGNPNPRSYYRCTHKGCPVRKHVEKASDDAKSILITYEGKHNHQPALGSDQPTASPSDKKTPANGELAGEDDKVSKLGGKNALESAQTLLSIGLNSSSGEEEASGANSDGMNRPLFEENCSAVSVQNS